MSRIEVHIDRLALSGLTPADARTVAATLHDQLTALLRGDPLPAATGHAAQSGRTAARAVHAAVRQAIAGTGPVPPRAAR